MFSYGTQTQVASRGPPLCPCLPPAVLTRVGTGQGTCAHTRATAVLTPTLTHHASLPVSAGSVPAHGSDPVLPFPAETTQSLTRTKTGQTASVVERPRGSRAWGRIRGWHHRVQHRPRKPCPDWQGEGRSELTRKVGRGTSLPRDSEECGQPDFGWHWNCRKHQSGSRRGWGSGSGPVFCVAADGDELALILCHSAPWTRRGDRAFSSLSQSPRRRYSWSSTENACVQPAQMCFLPKCQCLLPVLQVASLSPESFRVLGRAASVPAARAFSPAESWFVWLTDGVPAPASTRLVKGLLFEGRRWGPTPHRPLPPKSPSWSRKAVRKFLIDIVYC